jgi:glycosyltransferase involved in cell wall biosynthesis
MYNGEKNVTAIITTYNNFDFTMATIWSLRTFFPKMKIIVADGGSEPEIVFKIKDYIKKRDENCIFTQFEGLYIEDYRNAAASLADTKYILFMDNDVKVLAEESLYMLMEILEEDESIAECGPYGIVISDRSKLISYVGTEFTGSMLISASPCYFALHRTSAFKEVGGMPKEWLYKLPKNFDVTVPGYNGDFTISRLYYERGYKVKSPNKKVPLIHWGRTTEWFNENRNAIDSWWSNNVNHIRHNPLNSCSATLNEENNYGWKF